ncbi:type IV-A pilus assembly ATPase PilB [Thiorhodococcus mannitoliphagus]|uniref:Type IV-A pilus assembly ATPase PilB n=1 Tax=Thiorhodococcus mannitoliphagus TaxID=329406 RepID=A0A6P1DMQ1_9GAMM|nr:type IV-A pilus assembly ATPase PilB [Thiorhodococcus mannitoliphagus]NEX19318.1 type IV-A pilus assembly ATPase PilB [Thiorhodococcus mannitoliphagus]
MSPDQVKVKPSGLAWRLVNDQLLSEEQMLTAYEAAAKSGEGFVQHLVKEKLLDSRHIALAASHEFGVPLLDLGAFDLSSLPISLIDERLIRKHRALPLLKRGNRLFLALSDPTNDHALEEIRFNTGLSTDAILVEEDRLSLALQNALEANDTTAMSDFADADLEDLDVGGGENDEDADDLDANIDEAPVVRYINKILVDAISSGASDIHFEPFEKFFRIRFRQDGILREVASPPLNLAGRMTARLKVMSRMNIAERRVPQDGRIKLKLSKSRGIDFRVNTLPTLYGEKVVLRILDSSAAQVGIESLGFELEQREAFLKAIQKPYGMILVTGPTGSGKTVSLYSALNILNQPDINISTVEDPVEIQVAGINQCNMNPKAGLTFAAALRSFLRQDPDIIMVGEIRDLETAEIAVKAAQTGHLVLSTLHTNDAPQTLTRLANMGIPPFNIASSVLLIMAQRLARRLCSHCRKPLDLPHEALKEEGFTDAEIAEGMTIYGPVGCDHCNKGYRGRVGIFQVMPVSEEVARLILEGGNSMQLAEQAKREGIADLRASGLRKVKSGTTSLEEINRVTKE